MASTTIFNITLPSPSYSSVEYDLDISANFTASPSDLLPKEVRVGNLFRDEFFTGYVGDYDTADTYAFSLDFYEGVDIYMTGLTADADIRLIEDRNGNGIVDSGEVVDISSNFGTFSEAVSTDISGDYLLQVYQHSGNTNYSLTFGHYSTSFA